VNRREGGDSRKLVARGTVLVDPRAAIAKLREYLLPEPAHYVLELVRVAVAGGASTIHLANDADDLVLTFDGEPLAARDLACLLDHLFSAADRRLRLLAIAVNTALGLNPRHVDLYTTAHELPAGMVARVRWISADVARAAGASRDDDAVTIDVVPAPDPFPARGMRVHVRERFGPAVVREFFASEPLETRLLRARTGALRVPLVRAGARLEPDPPPRALLTVDLEEPASLRGALALVAPGELGNVLDLCEYGVLLERRELLPGGAAGPSRWPLWMRVDADELPTNASRSRVTLEGRFARDLDRAREAALAKLVTVALPALDGPAAPAVRESIAALLVSACGTHLTGAAPESMPEALRPLLDAPLIPLATGGFTTLRALGTRAPLAGLLAWQGREPLPPDLAPWIQNVVWLPARDTALGHLLARFQPVDARPAIEQATQARERYVRFMAHPPRAPRVAGRRRTEVLRLAFGQPHDDPGEDGTPGATVPLRTTLPADLRGEVVVRLPAPGVSHELRVTPYLDGRPLATESFGPAPLPLDVAVQAPGLRARTAFDGAERNDALEQAVAAALRVLLEGLGFAATALLEPGAVGRNDPRLAWIGPAFGSLGPHERAAMVRATVGLAVADKNQHGRRAAAATLLAEHPALAQVPAWPTTEPGRLVSLAELTALVAREPRVLCLAPPEARGARDDDRPVLALNERDRTALEALLPVGTRWSDYGRFLTPERARDLRALLPDGEDWAQGGGPWLALEDDGVRALVAPSQRGRLLVVHRGQVVEARTRLGRFGSVAIALEDDHLVPPPAGESALAGYLSHTASAVLEAAEFDLAVALTRALTGDRDAAAALGISELRHPPSTVVRYLLDALVALGDLGDGETVGRAFPMPAARLRELISALPLVTGLCKGQMVRLSVHEIAARGQQHPVLYLREIPRDIAAEDFEPLCLEGPEMALALEAAARVKILDASSEVAHRRAARARRLARQALRARRAVTFQALGRDADGPVAYCEVEGAGRAAIAVAAPGTTAPKVQVVVDNRIAIEDCPLPEACPVYPVVMRVAPASDEALTTGLDALTESGRRVVEKLYHCALDQLAEQVAQHAHVRDISDRELAFVARWMDERGRILGAGAKLVRALADAPLWRTVQGERVSARAFAVDGQVQYCTVEFSPWLSAAEGEDDEGSRAVLLPPGRAAREQRECLKTLAGVPARDVTDSLRRVQRQRRLRALGSELVALPGVAPAAALRGRIEQLEPSLGVGEIRVVPAVGEPRMTVALYEGGKLRRQLGVAAPLALDVALETALVDLDQISGTHLPPAVHAALLRAAHMLFLQAFSRGARLPSWSLPAARWHLLTGEALTDAERSVTAFLDSAGAPMSLADLDAQHARHGFVAYTVDPPAQPCVPMEPGLRVVVLTAREAALLDGARHPRDYTQALRDDQLAREHETLPPAEVIALRGEVPAGATRHRLDLARDGFEGEVVLLLSGEEKGAAVQWFWHRRPLGESTITAPWPALVALEAPELTPNRARSAPVENEALEQLRREARRLVRAALDAQFAVPRDAVASTLLTDKRSPAYGKKGARAVGALWLLPSVTAPALVSVTPWGPREPVWCEPVVRVPGVSRVTLPLRGTMWLARVAGSEPSQWASLFEDIVRWAYGRMLDVLVEAGEHVGPAAMAHLVWAAAHGFLVSEATSEWARCTPLPGSATPFSKLTAMRRDGQRLAVVEPGDPRAKHPGTVERQDAPWFEVLLRCGLLDEPSPAPRTRPAPPAVMPPPDAPEAPLVAVESGAEAQPVESPRPWRDKRAPRPEPTVADRVYELLRQLGLASSAVRAVVLGQGRAKSLVAFDPGERRATVYREHELFRALEAGPPERAVRVLAVAVLGEVNRALVEVGDADEERVLDALLADLARDNR
jgi:hypothetical protein